MSKFVLTAQLQLQAPNNVKQVVQQIQSQLGNLKVNVAAAGAVQANKNLQNLTKSADTASDSFTRMGKSFTASVRRFSALAIATRAVSLFTNTLSNAIQESIDFERELVKISQVTGKTVAQLQGLTNTITSLSTSLGVSSNSLLSVSRILAQTGLSARDTEVALGTLAKSELAPTFDNITQTAEGAVAILNQFGQGAAALEAQLGSLNAVAGQFAVEAGDLISVVRRTGGVFKAAGGDLNELIALFTSVRATTRESAESISTGLRTIFTRIQRPETIEFLRQYGVELLDLEGKFVGPYEAVRRLSQALAGLEQGDITFVQIAEELGGFRQIGKVIPLLQQFSVAQAALNVAQEGSGSLATDAAKAQAALAIQITKVKEEFLALVRSITSSSTFQIMADTVLTLTSALIKLADALSPIIPLLTAFAGIKLAGVLGSGLGKLAGFNKGGKVMQFARGGMVPGSGNRDTVPAMLTPGEFVIKKSSVQKLGAGNLEAMNNNKFAAGGVVTSDRHMYGDNAPSAATLKALETRKRNAALRREKEGKQGGTIQGATLNSRYGVSFLEGGAGNIGATINQVLKYGNATGKKILQQAIRESGKTVTPGARIDSPNAVPATLKSNAKDIFDEEIMAGLPNLFDQATSRFGAPLNPGKVGVNQLVSKSALQAIKGYFFEAFARRISQNLIADNKQDKVDSIFDFTGAGNVADLKKMFGGKFVNPNEFKVSATPENVANAISKAISTRGIGSISLFAKGGSVGTDTVPALLTPGESVVNRESAQKIGYSNLHRMNKVAKFAKGGVVGKKVKAFADGGTSGSDTGSVMINVAPLNAALTSTAQALTSLVSGVVNTATALNNLTQATFNNLAATGQITSQQQQAANTVIKSNQATLQAINAKNQEFKASLQAAAADDTEAKSSLGAAKADQAEAKSGNGLMLAFSALTTGISMLTPTIDENSSAGARFGAKIGDLILQFSTLAFLLQGLEWKTVAGGLSSVSQSLSGLSSGIGRLGGVLGKIPGAGLVKGAGKLVGGSVASAGGFVNQGIGKVSRMAARATGATSSMGGFGTAGSATGNFAQTAKALTSLANPATLAAAAIAAVIASIYLWNSSIAEAADAAKKKAIEDGNAAEAVKQAQIQAGGEQGKGMAKGMAAGALTGAALGAFLGPIGMAVGAALGAWAGSFFSDFFTPFDKTAEVLTKTANAAALQVAAQKALAESGKAATEAMEKFRNGNATASEALAATSAGTAAVVASQQATIAANTALMKNTRTAASAVGDFLVGLTGFSFGFGTTAQNEQKAQAQIDDNNKEQDRLSKEAVSQNQPAINALSKQVAVAGGDFATFFAKLQAANPGLAKLADQDELKKAFENVQKEVERTQAAFAAMNLGFQGVNAAATAAGLAVDNLVGGFEGTSNAIERSIATLEAGVTNAAQGISDEAFSGAVDSAAAQIERFGGDATKFRENLTAINTAQKFFARASADAKAKLQADFARGVSDSGVSTAEGRRGALADAIVGQMDGVGEDVKKRIKTALEGADISQEDMDAILAGDMSVLDKVLKDLGDTTLSQVMPALKAAAEIQNKLNSVISKRLALENEFAAATKRQIDVTLEAAKIMQEFGGAQVTPQMQSQAAVDRLNVTGAQLGLPQMSTGSADEIRRRNAEINAQMQAQANDRNLAAAGDTEAQARINTPEFQANEERLKKAAEETYNETKKLIDARREEIKIINAKTAAEKKATDALLGNNVEEFLDQMAGRGAAAAAAIGDPTLAGQFGASAFGTANKQLEEMQNAGVTTFMGQDIGAVRQSAVGMGLSNAGLSGDIVSDLAKAATGTTDAAEAAKAAARDLASTLPQSTGNLQSATGHMLQATQILESTVEKQAAEATARVEERSAGAAPAAPAAPATPSGAVPTGAAPTGATPPATPDPSTTTTTTPAPVPTPPSAPTPPSNIFEAGYNAFSSPSAMAPSAPTAAAPASEQQGFASGLQSVQTSTDSLTSAITPLVSQFAGLSTSLNSVNTTMQSLIQSFSNLPSFDFSGLEGIASTFDNFNSTFSATVDRLEGLNIQVQVAPTNVNVNLTGGEFLKSIEGRIREDIMNSVATQIKNIKHTPNGGHESSGGNLA